MRTVQEIEDAFKAYLKEATKQFVGEKVTPEIKAKIQHAITEATYDYYMDLSEEEIQAYDIKIPRAKVIINGPEISIENK